MKTIEYNKLVRDRAPYIIGLEDNNCEIELLNDVEFLKLLDERLDEEMSGYHKVPSLEKLADIVEVIRTITTARGYTVEQFEELRLQREKDTGAFESKFKLVNVYIKDE